MADWLPRSRLVKIVLGIGCVFSVIAIVCLGVGGSFYVQQRSKAKSYTEDSCRVQSTSYETINKCITGTSKVASFTKCFVATWLVEFGQNGTRKATIRDRSEYSSESMSLRSDRYKVGSSYPCWYNTEKPFDVTWYAPQPFVGIILLIIGGIAIPFAIISMIFYFRLRERADL